MSSIITGKDCSLSVGGKDFSTVINSFALKFDQTKVEYNVLKDGPLAAGGSESGTLSITYAYDGQATTPADSLHHALWNAAGTSVAFIAQYGTDTYTGKAIAVRPGANATAGEVAEVTVEMALDGMPTLGTKAAGKA